MFIRKIIKKNPNSDKVYHYFRLVHSYRIGNKTRQLTLLNLGRLDNLDPIHHKALADRIEQIVTGASALFTFGNEVVEPLAQKFANQIKDKKIFDTANKKAKFGEQHTDDEPQFETVDLSTIDKEDDNEIGGSWLCKQAFDYLKLANIFEGIGLSKKQIDQSMSLLTAKMIHPSSELESERWMLENSALSELYGSQGVPSRYQMYKVTEQLYNNKTRIENQVYTMATNLFSSQNKIIIYDLTNMYFEGRMLGSEKAEYGRSKEKRTDCKLIGLSLVIDAVGLVRHCKIYRGNISEPGTLKGVLNDLKSSLTFDVEKPVVVMDAGISTDVNLDYLSENGYDYVCVCRSAMKAYTDISQQETLIKSKQGGHSIHLKKVNCTKRKETMLYVRSEQKALKEESMDSKKTERFEEALKYLKAGLDVPRRLKKINKVHEKIGRLRQQYSTVSKLYKIDYVQDTEKDVVTDILWKRQKNKEKQKGVYFLRYSRENITEKQIWDVYNLTREVEASIRCLKTDLNIRPIYHQKDKWIESHIWLSILAYQVVQTIRLKLAKKDIHYSWSTIVEKMKSQQTSLITIKTKENKMVYARLCSKPKKTVQEIYDALEFKHRPYVRKINVVTQL